MADVGALETPVTATPLPGPATPVPLLWSSQFDMASKISGRTYRIYVFQPPIPAPPSGYPMLVTLDGNMTFPIAATMAAMYAFSMAPALVVGVGYPTDNPLEMVRLRVRDLTPETPPERVPNPAGAPPVTADDIGGADLFRRFLTEELRPVIAAAHTVDPAHETLFGYSLSGLFTLDALFKQPNAFRSYVASSPSIWWNECDLLTREAAFVDAVESQTAQPRVLVTVGANEQDAPTRLPPGETPESAQAMADQARMVENALELGARLSRLKGGDGYEGRFCAFEDEDHLTCMAAAVGRALDFALTD
jgi:hypothetical protein